MDRRFLETLFALITVAVLLWAAWSTRDLIRRGIVRDAALTDMNTKFDAQAEWLTRLQNEVSQLKEAQEARQKQEPSK